MTGRRVTARRGVVLVESVLAISMLVFVLAATWFFGWAMTNQQRVKASARHVTWRSCYGGVAPNQGDLVNEQFLHRKSNNADAFGGRVDLGTPADYVTAAATVSTGAAALAQRGPGSGLGAFDPGRRYSVTAGFPTSVGAWNRYQGDIRSHALREGLEWRYSQAGIWPTVNELYMTAMDRLLASVPEAGSGMANMVHGLYHNAW